MGVLLSVNRRLTVSGNPFAGHGAPSLPSHQPKGDLWRTAKLTTFFASVFETFLHPLRHQMVPRDLLRSRMSTSSSQRWECPSRLTGRST